MATFRNIGGQWKSGNFFRNIGGQWRAGSMWRKIGNVWKNLSVVFTPDGGDVYGSGQYEASATLYCNVPATWVYSTVSGSGGTVSLASGGSSTFIIFSQTATGPSGNKLPRKQVWSVTGMANGVTRNFTVTVEAFGDNQ